VSLKRLISTPNWRGLSPEIILKNKKEDTNKSTNKQTVKKFAI